MTISFCDSYKVDFDKFENSGALDPIIGIDTRLFIDPSLLRHTSTPGLEDCSENIKQYFTDVIRLIKASKSPNDVFWRKADQTLQFPEVKGLCIGYSSNGVAGRGMGKIKRAKLLKTISDIINAGNEDPTIFELVGAFEEGVGPDLISDMIAKIIMPNLISYTQRVCSQLGIPMHSLSYAKGSPPEDLPCNPQNNEPIILIPKEILRDLPVAETYADLEWICQQNQSLRDYINSLIVGSIRSLTPVEKKSKIKDTFTNRPDVLEFVIQAYLDSPPKHYDYKNDPSGETIWYRATKQLPNKYELDLKLSHNPTLDEVFSVTKEICLHYKKLLEDNQLCKLLYNENGSRKRESAAQLLFFGIASAYCEANDLDLSPECDSGRGPVDFKVSSGFKGRVLVEMKLTSNTNLIHGFETQLPIYQAAECTQKGIYLVINNDGISEKRWDRFLAVIKNAKGKCPEMIYADGIPRSSASKAEY